jgi:hypothetical protein
VSCSRPLDQAWTICPYCETEVPGLSTSRRNRRRRAAVAEGEHAEVGAGGSRRTGSETAVEPQLSEASPEIGRKGRGDTGEDVAPGPLVTPETSAGVRGAGRGGRPGGRPRPAP